MSYYEGTYIDRLPLELQDKLGVPVVVGRLLTLPVELIDYVFITLDMIIKQATERRAVSRVNRTMRGYLVRNRALRWPNVVLRRRFNMRQARHLEAQETYRFGTETWQVPIPLGQ